MDRQKVLILYFITHPRAFPISALVGLIILMVVLCIQVGWHNSFLEVDDGPFVNICQWVLVCNFGMLVEKCEVPCALIKTELRCERKE